MFHHIRGILNHAGPAAAVIEAGGVGYRLTISLATHRALPAVGSEALLYTHFSVSETAQTLYGFATEDERALFRALIGISGVGPATATQILSGTTPDEFSRAIQSQDHTALKKIKGIGEKTAKRILLELKDSALLATRELAPEDGGAGVPAPAKDVASAARQALETLGIAPREATARVEKVLSSEPTLALEDVIRKALQ